MVTRDELFNSAKTQDDISEVFAYAAIGIWVTDIVWNIVGASKLNISELWPDEGIFNKDPI